jgi:hypothetical protein
MATRFIAGWKLRGANGKTTVKNIDLGVISDTTAAAEYGQAVAAMATLRAAFAAVTDAVIAEERIASMEVLSAATPAEGDLFQNAMINVWSLNTEDANAVEHLAQVYIPAPVIGVFSAATGSGRDVVDITDADLTAWIAALAADAEISDGETIQTGTGDDGMADGRRVVKKVRLGN